MLELEHGCMDDEPPRLHGSGRVVNLLKAAKTTRKLKNTLSPCVELLPAPRLNGNASIDASIACHHARISQGLLASCLDKEEASTFSLGTSLRPNDTSLLKESSKL